MKTLFTPLSLIIALSLVLAACAPASTAPDQPSVAPQSAGPIVFADPQFNTLYQAARENNPQYSGTELEFAQWFYSSYGGAQMQEVFAVEYAKARGDIAFVQASSVTALSNPPGWLYALALFVGTTAYIAMQANDAMMLQLPTIPVEQISESTKMLIVAASAVLAAETTIVWTEETLLVNTTVLAEQATIDVAELHVLDNDHRTAQRLALATLLWTSTVTFNNCYHRPGSSDSDEAIIIEFPIANLWGGATQFLFNKVHPSRSTFLTNKGGIAPPNFVQLPCTDKKASKAYQYLKELLDLLSGQGKLPFYPQ